MNNGMRQFAWLTPPTDEHPKGKFHRGNKPMETDEQMQMAVKHHWQDACYESTYRFADWTGGRLPAEIAKSAIIDVVYLDFDDKDDPQQAMRDAAEVAAYVGHTEQWFSGMKGAGMLIHCQPVNLIPDLKSHVITRFVINLIDVLCEVETCDFAVVGDLNRVHRIINTKHQKPPNLYAIPLAASELSEFSIDKIKEMARHRRNLVQRPTPSRWVASQLYKIEDDILTERLDRLWGARQLSATSYYTAIRRLERTTFRDRAGMYNEIKALEDEWRRIQTKKLANMPTTRQLGRTKEETWLMKVIEIFRVVQRAANIQPAGSMVSTSSSEHEARCHLVKLAYYDCDWPIDKVCDIFTDADDYNPAITERMVRSLIGRR